jgi:hypothetical protein
MRQPEFDAGFGDGLGDEVGTGLAVVDEAGMGLALKPPPIVVFAAGTAGALHARFLTVFRTSRLALPPLGLTRCDRFSEAGVASGDDSRRASVWCVRRARPCSESAEVRGRRGMR